MIFIILSKQRPKYQSIVKFIEKIKEADEPVGNEEINSLIITNGLENVLLDAEHGVTMTSKNYQAILMRSKNGKSLARKLCQHFFNFAELGDANYKKLKADYPDILESITSNFQILFYIICMHIHKQTGANFIILRYLS